MVILIKIKFRMLVKFIIILNAHFIHKLMKIYLQKIELLMVRSDIKYKIRCNEVKANYINVTTA